MSQEDVAKAMHTTQSVIARIESGKKLPSMSTINRFAEAVGMKPELHFKPI